MQFRVEADTPARVSIYSTTGRRVYELSGGYARVPGELTWNGTDENGRPLPGGIYFVRLSTPKAHLTNKVVLLR